MTEFVATATSLHQTGRNNMARYRTRFDSARRSERLRRARDDASEQRVMINQPIDAVVAFLRVRGGEGEIPPATSVSSEWEIGSDEVDPVIRRTLSVIGRQVEVTYTLYSIPGGTQITAVVGEQSGRVAGPVHRLVVASIRRQIAAELASAKESLE